MSEHDRIRVTVSSCSRPKKDDWVLLRQTHGCDCSGSIPLDSEIPVRGDIVTLLGFHNTNGRGKKQFRFKHCLTYEALMLVDKLSTMGVPESSTIKAITYRSDITIEHLESIILKNPYSLIKMAGMSFDEIESIYLQFGVNPCDDVRLVAIAMHFYNRSDYGRGARIDGNTVADLSMITSECIGYMPHEHKKYMETFLLINISDIGIDPSMARMFVKMDDNVISSNMHYRRAHGITGWCNTNSKQCDVSHTKSELSHIDSLQLSHSQRMAIGSSLSNTFTIITGCAGFGKTTITKAIAEASDSDYIFCSPTGKAVSRIKEVIYGSTGEPVNGVHTHQIETIHRMLGFNGRVFNAEGLEGKTLVIDEASMISSDIMYEILIRKPSGIILIGDPAQLPPVADGFPFGDLIEQYPHCVIELDFNFRASGAINQVSVAVRAGAVPSDEIIISGGEEFHRKHMAGLISVKQYLYKQLCSGAIDFEKDIIISFTNNIVDEINAAVRDIVNPGQQAKWGVNDRIIFQQNNCEKGFVNGDIAVIVSAPMGRQHSYVVSIVGSNRMVTLSANEMNTCKHAYALTVHKSQGSEYRNVYYVVLGSGFGISKPLVYTAITRAKNICNVIGNQSILNKKLDTVVRCTALQYTGRK